MKPYSQDLRERVIAALEAGKTQAEVAAQLGIHKSTLEKWWYRWRDTGSCAALPPAHGPERTLQAAESFLRVSCKLLYFDCLPKKQIGQCELSREILI